MKVWISKYALSGGITEHDVPETAFSEHEGRKYVAPGRPFASFAMFRIGIDAHLSREEAVKMANARLVKQLASLRRQIQKLERLTFE